MRFWQGQLREPREQAFDYMNFEWIDVQPGLFDEDDYRWSPYHGRRNRAGWSPVIMSPYMLGEVTVFGMSVDLAVRLPSAYGPVEGD
jgi:hypothetical protein